MSSYVTRKTPGDTAWFRHDRFGMFIHFGLYALPSRHEWVKNHECTPEEKLSLIHISGPVRRANCLPRKTGCAWVCSATKWTSIP